MTMVPADPLFRRTFLVSARRFKPRWIALGVLVWSAFCVGACVALKDHFPAREAFDAAFAAARSLAVVVYMALVVMAFLPKKSALVLTRDSLTVDGGRGGVFSLLDARLGTWNVAYHGTKQGTALHLRNGERRYVLGGQDHRIAPAMQCGMVGPVESVDAYVDAAGFDAILALLPSLAHGPTPLEANREAGPAITRCWLVPNRGTPMAALSAIFPWIVSMVLLVALGGGLSALGLLDSHTSQLAFAVLAVVLFVGGIAGAAVRSRRTARPGLAIEVDAHDARVIDAGSNRLLAVAPLSQVIATPAEHRCTGRSSYSVPVLVLVFPGSQAISLGIYDFRFAWQGKVRRQGAPEYVVGGADWLALVEGFGLRRLLDGAGARAAVGSSSQ